MEQTALSPRTNWRRRTGRALLALLVFMLGYPLLYAAMTREQRPAPLALPLPSPGQYRVFVVDWGYHTAIVVEQPRGWRLGPPGAEAAPFLEFAWGDRRFYMESDYWAIFATLFLPTESVLYVSGRPDPPQLGGAEAVLMRTVDATTVRALFAEVEASVRRSADGARLAPYAPAVGYRGRFYPAYGRYIWSRDCNWWTVARLGGAGLADAPTGVVFTPQVPGRLRGFAREASRQAPR